MAKRRQRRSSRSKSSGYPPVVWMLFGLAIGLSVAFAVYINSREPARVTKQSTPQPASMQSALDDNGETAPEPEPAPAPVRKDKRFTFYDILPNVEILTSDSTMQAPADSTPKAVEEPGVYVLQAGSFSTNADADRRRAELALQGIESHIQRVKVNDRDYHRVYIGPTDDLDELNMLRSRLRVAQIDVLRIRVSD
ncbi:MAG: SPOR domain-containing protein [Woeseiaceae bacterium]